MIKSSHLWRWFSSKPYGSIGSMTNRTKLQWVFCLSLTFMPSWCFCISLQVKTVNWTQHICKCDAMPSDENDLAVDWRESRAPLKTRNHMIYSTISGDKGVGRCSIEQRSYVSGVAWSCTTQESAARPISSLMDVSHHIVWPYHVVLFQCDRSWGNCHCATLLSHGRKGFMCFRF